MIETIFMPSLSSLKPSIFLDVLVEESQPHINPKLFVRNLFSQVIEYLIQG